MALPTQRRILSHAAAATLSRGFNTTTGQYDLAPNIHDNVGAAGSVTLTLPATAEVGDTFLFNVAAAQALVVYGGAAGVFTLAATTYTAGFSLRQAGTIGTTCEVICTGANAWRVVNVVGTWTVS